MRSDETIVRLGKYSESRILPVRELRVIVWMRRSWIWIGLVAVVTIAVGLSVTQFTQARPNILLITLDTTRADRLGCYGYSGAQTPKLDSLADRGVVFERAYAPAPMTAPSHTSLFTGLCPPEHGVFTNAQVALDPGIPTLAELLKAQSYETAAFVAAFVLQKKFGLERGFHVYDDDLSSADQTGDPLHRYRDGRIVIDSAVRWLSKRTAAARPFFCWVHLYDPHEPYLAHEPEFGDQFRDQPYDGEVAYVDRQLGRLFDALKKSGVERNTVVVVIGDHGESLGEHGERAHGYMLHESTLRVPLIIADPRRDAGGLRISTPVSLIDLFPTLLEFADAKAPQESKARSLHAALAGGSIAPSVCYSQTEEPYLQAFWSPLQGLTTQRWRYVRTTKPELYDLQADPKELHNLAHQEPDKLAELDGELAALEAQFRRRSGAQVQLSSQERRALETLGYAGGNSAAADRPTGDAPLPDIKDMIGYFNRAHDATELMEQQKFGKAAEILEPLAAEAPTFLRVRLNLGFCQIQLGRYEEAARWLESALLIDPNSDRTLDLLALAYLKLKNLDLAERYSSRLIELRPESEHGHLYLGEVYQRRENFPTALRLYERVLQINPQNRQARELVQAMRSAGIRP